MFYIEILVELSGSVKDVKIHHEGKVIFFIHNYTYFGCWNNIFLNVSVTHLMLYCKYQERKSNKPIKDLMTNIACPVSSYLFGKAKDFI